MSNFLSPLVGPGGGTEIFPSPWRDMASLSMPDNYANALEWAEFCFFANSTYAKAQQRIVAYFLTDLEVKSTDSDKSVGDDEREKWLTFSHDDAEILSKTGQLDIDTACYGNGFASLLVPFRRLLMSDKSRRMIAFREMAEDTNTFGLSYDASNNKFMAKDPVTKERCEWSVHDVPYETVQIKIWNPKEIQIIWDFWTHDCMYLWKIPADYKREIRRGNMHMLERAPLEVLKAIQKEQHFMFSPDAIYHMREPTLSGVKMRGWGLSKAMVNYRDIWYVQVLRRFNEAIAMDYVVPFRVITPDSQPAAQGTGDPLRMMNMGDWQSQMRRMLRQHRRDPASWHTMPYPIKYQALGGEASQLAPHELLDQGTDMMLNAAGAPAEFYRGTLQFNVAPVALRLFEASHYSLVHNNNQFLRWFVDRSSQLLPLPQVRLSMRRVTYADDFSKNMAALQMFMAQQLSGTTALGGLGYEWRDETRQIAEEERFRQKIKADLDEEMQQTAFGEQIAKGQSAGGGPPPQGGVPPQGGAPSQNGAPAPGAGSPVDSAMIDLGSNATPEDMISTAQGLAQSLSVMQPGQRISELRALKQKNEIIHSLVKAKLDEIRNKARQTGSSMLLQQQQQQPVA